MKEACIDTTFLIDLQRSRRNQFYQDAMEWMKQNPMVNLKLPVVVAGEFAAGFADPFARELSYICANHEILPMEKEVAFEYREIFRDLKDRGELIGANDLWIAAIALRFGMPLVTRNVEHFRRVNGLLVEAY